MRYPLPWFPLSDDPSRYSCRTTVNCRPYRPSRVGCRFGRSGSSGFVGGFLRLRWSSCVLMPRIRAYRTYPTSGLEDSCWLQFAITCLQSIHVKGRNSIFKLLLTTNSLNLSEKAQIKSSFISFAQNSKPDIFSKNIGG